MKAKLTWKPETAIQGRAGDAEDADVAGEHGRPEPGDKEGGDGGEEERDGGDGGAREPAAEGAVEEEAEEGEERDPPEIGGGHLSGPWGLALIEVMSGSSTRC